MPAESKALYDVGAINGTEPSFGTDTYIDDQFRRWYGTIAPDIIAMNPVYIVYGTLPNGMTDPPGKTYRGDRYVDVNPDGGVWGVDGMNTTAHELTHVLGFNHDYPTGIIGEISGGDDFPRELCGFLAPNDAGGWNRPRRDSSYCP